MEIVREILVTVLMLNSLVMTLFILVQDGKGGNVLVESDGRTIEGVTNPVRRATVVTASIWMVCAICLGVMAAQ